MEYIRAPLHKHTRGTLGNGARTRATNATATTVATAASEDVVGSSVVDGDPIEQVVRE